MICKRCDRPITGPDDGYGGHASPDHCIAALMVRVEALERIIDGTATTAELAAYQGIGPATPESLAELIGSFPDAPIMEDRGRMVEVGPYDIMVGGVKVGEIPELFDGHCSLQCTFNSDNYHYNCMAGLHDPVGIGIRPGHKCPRHPDHGKEKS